MPNRLVATAAAARQYYTTTVFYMYLYWYLESLFVGPVSDI